MTGRRELLVALLGCLAGAGLVLLAARQVWVVARPADPESLARPVRYAGGQVSAPSAALGLVGLAGAAAVLAARGRWRAVVGGLVAAAGVAIAGLGVAATSPGWLASAVRAVSVSTDPRWPLVSAAGGVVLAAAGGLTLLRGRSWPALGSRYDAPGTGADRPASAGPAPPDRDRALWEAQDAGVDPTADPPGPATAS